MKILLDTCALIWWTVDQQQLPVTILSQINAQPVYVSSISIWEVGIKIKQGKLNIGMDIQTYVNKLQALALEILPVTEQIWVENLNLSWNHKDPADRTIVATAALTASVIVTSDKIISDYYPKILWEK